MTGRACPRRDRTLLVSACLAVMLAAADTYVVVLAMTDMMAGVGLGIESLQRATPIISGFLLGYVAVLPLIGRLADLLDRQRVLLACLVVFAVGSVVTALAVELPVLVAGRLVQGVGGGGLVPATLALVADRWPPERRGLPLGVVGAMQELGSVLGPLLGAAILAFAGWRAIFWANAVVALVLGVVIRLCGNSSCRSRPARVGRMATVVAVLAGVSGLLALWAPDRLTSDLTLGIPFIPLGKSGSRLATPLGVAALVLAVVALGLTAGRWWPLLRRADLPGALLLAVALGSLILTFASADPAREVVGPLGVVLLPIALGALVLAVLWHRRARDPLLPRGAVTPAVLLACLVSGCVGVALVAVVVDVPLLARLQVTSSETEAALILVRFLVAVPLAALAGGALLRVVPPRVVTAVGLALTALALWGMSRWGLDALGEAVSTVPLVGAGLGLGMTIAPVSSVALARTSEASHAVIASLVVVARMVGMVVGLALLTAVGLHRFYAAVAALPDPADAHAVLGAALVQVQTVFFGAALAAAFGALLAVGLSERGVSR